MSRSKIEWMRANDEARRDLRLAVRFFLDEELETKSCQICGATSDKVGRLFFATPDGEPDVEAMIKSGMPVSEILAEADTREIRCTRCQILISRWGKTPAEIRGGAAHHAQHEG